MSAAPPPRARAASGLVTGSLVGFVILGLPDGMAGVAWPSLRAGFDQPLGSLGELLLASLAGYLAVTVTAGRALHRAGTAALLMAAALTATAGAALIAAAPAWVAVAPGALLLGAAGGSLDAALNTLISLDRRPALMNLIHAAYGLGAALGPLLVTAAIAAGSAWRGAYAVLAGLELVLLAVWIAVRGTVPRIGGAGPPAVEPAVAASPAPSPPSRHAPERRRRCLLPLSLALFFCYTGLEATVGAWAPSFLRGPLRMPAVTAGLALFLYWAGLGGGRVLAAALGSRLPAQRAAWMGAAVSLGGAILVWAGIDAAITVVALPVIGLGLGPIFPALMTLTPPRLGRALAIHAVGWQLAAAGVGGAGLSALLGVVLQTAGLLRLGPALALLAAIVLTLDLLLDRASA